MRFELLTLFPEMLRGALASSVLGKGAEAGLLEFEARDIRAYAEGRHRVCDDTPYGGGAGMVMKPEPLVAAIEAARAEAAPEARQRVIMMSPRGERFSQAHARRLVGYDHLVLVCGRYEGVDERALAYVDEELSLGDFVLSGGEPAALAVIDAVARLVPGVLGNAASIEEESHTSGLLEYPQYTRPVSFRGVEVPEILRSGDHGRVALWRLGQALLLTQARRPDLFEGLELGKREKKALALVEAASKT